MSNNVAMRMFMPIATYYVLSFADAGELLRELVSASPASETAASNRDLFLVRATCLEDSNWAVPQELLRNLRNYVRRATKTNEGYPAGITNALTVLQTKVIRGATGDEIMAARLGKFGIR